MRLWAVLGAIASLLAGPPAPAKPADPRDPVVGCAIEGADFYVWDEDRDEAERWARELAESRGGRRWIC